MDLNAVLSINSDESDKNRPAFSNDAFPFHFTQKGMTNDLDVVSGPAAINPTNMPLGLGPFAENEILKDLHETYLRPSPAFDDEILDNCAKTIRREPNVDHLFQWGQFLSNIQLRDSMRTETFLPRDRISGAIDFENATEFVHNHATADPKVSTSMQRRPGAYSDFVRGKSTHVPFAPGGMIFQDTRQESDQTGKNQDIEGPEDEDISIESLLRGGHGEQNHLKLIPPGFERGLVFEDMSKKDILTTSNDSKTTTALSLLLQEKLTLNAPEQIPSEETNIPDVTPSPRSNAPQATSKDASSAIIDDILPENVDDGVDVITLGPQNSSNGSTGFKREWAHMVDVTKNFPDFEDLVPELALSYPFELDVFQKQAVYHLEQSESVFVAAHTSAGKTVVAEYAIALAQKHMTRAIYTSPIKALSNQKYRDFKLKFGDVGILTGDVQIQPEASCLVMTTEILRSMLYRGADLIRDVEFVIFDEVHYVNDIDRGVVWEEVIIMLPAHVTLILLSATVPNTREFADWVGRTKQKDIYVISTSKRPVPLEHYLALEKKDFFKIVDAKKTFYGTEYKKAYEVFHPPRNLAGSQAQRGGSNTSGGRGGRGGSASNRGASNRGGSASRGNVRQSAVSTRGGSSSSGSRSNNNQNAAAATDRNLYVHLIGTLKKKELLPAIVFSFSKKKCELYASALSNLDLTAGASEKSEIHIFIEKSLMCLKGSDKELPQVMRMRDLLSRGIAVHHSGLLPILKEIVEILFTRGLVRVLFATETFAMGVNAPARCVVFSSLKKHDGQSFRELSPGEYTQMSGRAGRRGLDDTGMVLIACADDVPDQTTLQKMLLGVPTKLESQFRITYNMILNLLRVEAIRVEDMIKRSFSENVSQRVLPEQQKLLDERVKTLQSLEKLDCFICNRDLYNFYDTNARISLLSNTTRDKVLSSPLAWKVLQPGRVIVLHGGMFQTQVPGVIVKVEGTSGSAMTDPLRRKLFVFVLSDQFDESFATQKTMLPMNRIHVPKASMLTPTVVTVPARDILFASTKILKLDPLLSLEDEDSKRQLAHHFHQLLASTNEQLEEYDWSKIKEVEFQEAYREKRSLLERLAHYKCNKCPDLVGHYHTVHQERLLQNQIAQLGFQLSDQNLELLPEYHQRIQVLKQLGYINDSSIVQLKGRVACEINTADELILTELIFNNILGDYDAAEVVALLSVLVFQEKSMTEPTLTPKLEGGLGRLKEIVFKVGAIQRENGLAVSEDELVSSLRLGLVEAVYEWARGLPFKHITDLTDVLEGSIVRCIVRLSETCREVASAARLIGDATLYRKMEEAGELIRRDIVFAASLYF